MHIVKSCVLAIVHPHYFCIIMQFVCITVALMNTSFKDIRVEWVLGQIKSNLSEDRMDFFLFFSPFGSVDR